MKINIYIIIFLVLIFVCPRTASAQIITNNPHPLNVSDLIPGPYIGVGNSFIAYTTITNPVGRMNAYYFDLKKGQNINITNDVAWDIYAFTVDKNRIVWSDNRDNMLGIYMYDVNKKKVSTVLNDAGWEYVRDVSGNLMVYTHYTDTSPQLSLFYLYDLEKKTKKLIQDDFDVQFADIYDDYIVYSGTFSPSTGLDFYLINTKKDTTIKLNDETRIIESAKIYKDHVALTIKNGLDRDVYLYDIKKQTFSPIDITPEKTSLVNFNNGIITYQNLDKLKIHLYNISSKNDLVIHINNSNAVTSDSNGDIAAYISSPMEGLADIFYAYASNIKVSADFSKGSWNLLSSSPTPVTLGGMAYDGSKYVYFAGGYKGGLGPDRHNGSNRFIRFDVESITWEDLGELPYEAYASHLLVGNGKLYWIVGAINEGQSRNFFYEYNVDDGLWNQLEDIPGDFSNSHPSQGSFTFDDSNYIYGSSYSMVSPPEEDFFRYDIAADQWEEMTSPEMSAHHILQSYKNYIYKIGGDTLDGDPVEFPLIFRDSIQRFNTLNNTWDFVSPAPEVIDSPSSSFDDEKTIYTSSGYRNRFFSYNLENNKWVRLKDSPKQLIGYQAIWVDELGFVGVSVANSSNTSNDLYLFKP